MRFIAAATAMILTTCSCQPTQAVEPQYSLDSLTHHPYRYVPASGYASQNPGSPKYFAPGHGYRIPGFGYSAPSLRTDTSYNNHYEFGQRRHGLYSDVQYRFRSNSYGGPWFHAGWSANTQNRWPAN